MSAALFVPGPWETYRSPTTYYNGPDDTGDPCIVTAPNDGVILAVCVPDAVPQFEANARLIAAAPELYDDNQRALHFLADLNGSDWIKGDDAGARDMRQRAKELQRRLFTNAVKARGES